MPCKAPLKAYRPTNGGPVTFTRPQARTYQEINLPCGQCILCRLEHTRQWAVRIVHETQFHEQSAFLTLTLSDEHMNELGSLDYRGHMQPFWKKLRKRLGTRIAYYAVGEYGEEKMRPHYHACIFGHDFRDGMKWVRRGENPLWRNKLLEETWGLGKVSVGVLNFQTAAYTAGYVTKKLTGNDAYIHLDDETGEITYLEQPKAYMSLKPAIGRQWVDKYGNAVYAHDYVIIGGRKQKAPKYYDEWLKKRSEIAIEMIKKGRIERAVKLTQNQIDARAHVARTRAKMKKRKG